MSTLKKNVVLLKELHVIIRHAKLLLHFIAAIEIEYDLKDHILSKSLQDMISHIKESSKLLYK